jgi:restriction endonuclease Mrr
MTDTLNEKENAEIEEAVQRIAKKLAAENLAAGRVTDSAHMERILDSARRRLRDIAREMREVDRELLKAKIMAALNERAGTTEH